METRSQTLSIAATQDAVDKKSVTNTVAATSKPAYGARKAFHSQINPKSTLTCLLCSGSHILARCYKLKAKSPYERRSEVRRLHVCFNCFGTHKVDECRSQGRCLTCKEKHYTLLHFDSKRPHDTAVGQGEIDESEPSTEGTPTVNALTASISQHKLSVILATAQVIIRGPNGRQARIRALLDQGSEATFITEAIARQLELPSRSARIALSGLGTSSAGTARSVTSFTLESIKNLTLI